MRTAIRIVVLLSAAAAAAEGGREVELGSTRATPTVDAPFESVALAWSGAAAKAAVRAAAPGGPWSDWIELTIDPHLTDGSDPRFITTIAHFGAAMGRLEVRIDGPAERPRAVLFPPPPSAGAPERSSASVAALGIRSRTSWGCPDGQGSRWTPAYTDVTHAVVHHTAGANAATDWEAEVRNIWYLHTVTRGWGDVGYNFLIDPEGTIYEGRAGGAGAIGAHFACRNSNTVGISLLGTYTSVEPTPAALESLRRLLGELAALHELDPAAFAPHIPTALTLPVVAGHRDANPSQYACSTTTCPGDVLYAMLPALRSDLAGCTPPRIVVPPASTIVDEEGRASLSVVASGSEPLAYQWSILQPGGTTTPIGGATGASLVVTPQAATWYTVRVTNGCGAAEADAAVFLEIAPRRRTAGR